MLRPIVEHERYDLGVRDRRPDPPRAVQVGRLGRRRRGHRGPAAGILAVRPRRIRPQSATPRTRSTWSRSTAASSTVATFFRARSSPAGVRSTCGSTPPKNGQRACLNLAVDFELPGAVAQLEEHLPGRQRARGSSPLSSTPAPPERSRSAATSSATTSGTTSSRPPTATRSSSAAEGGPTRA